MLFPFAANLAYIFQYQFLYLSLFSLLVIIYGIPKLLETLVSKLLSGFLPCDVSIGKFGFFKVQQIIITFINGEIIFIDLIYVTSKLIDPKARSLFGIILANMEFQTTREGLYSLIQATRNKNRLNRCNRGNSGPWKTQLWIRARQLFSVSVRNIRIGVWPSLPNPTGARIFDLSERGGSRCYPGTDAVHSLNHPDPLEACYGFANESGLGAVLQLDSVALTFRSGGKAFYTHLETGRLCIRLLRITTPAEPGVQSAAASPLHRLPLICCLDPTTTGTEAALVGHACVGCCRLSLKLPPLVAGSGSGGGGVTSSVVCRLPWASGSCRWSLHSACLRCSSGLRVTLLEELVDLLLLTHKSPATARGVNPATDLLQCQPKAMATRSFSMLSTGWQPVGSLSLVDSGGGRGVLGYRTSSSSPSLDEAVVGGRQTESPSRHLCLHLLPGGGGRKTPDCPSSREPLEQQQWGFQLNLIRRSFKQSLQFNIGTLQASINIASTSPPTLPTSSSSSQVNSANLATPGPPPTRSFLHGLDAFPGHHWPCMSSPTSTCCDGNEADCPHRASGRRWNGCFLATGLSLTSGWNEVTSQCALDLHVAYITSEFQVTPEAYTIRASTDLVRGVYAHQMREAEFLLRLLRVALDTRYRWLFGGDQRDHNLRPWQARQTFKLRSLRSREGRANPTVTSPALRHPTQRRHFNLNWSVGVNTNVCHRPVPSTCTQSADGSTSSFFGQDEDWTEVFYRSREKEAPAVRLILSPHQDALILFLEVTCSSGSLDFHPDTESPRGGLNTHLQSSLLGLQLELLGEAPRSGGEVSSPWPLNPNFDGLALPVTRLLSMRSRFALLQDLPGTHSEARQRFQLFSLPAYTILYKEHQLLFDLEGLLNICLPCAELRCRFLPQLSRLFNEFHNIAAREIVSTVRLLAKRPSCLEQIGHRRPQAFTRSWLASLDHLQGHLCALNFLFIGQNKSSLTFTVENLQLDGPNDYPVSGEEPRRDASQLMLVALETLRLVYASDSGFERDFGVEEQPDEVEDGCLEVGHLTNLDLTYSLLDKTISLVCHESCRFAWHLAFHLCLQDLVELISGMRVCYLQSLRRSSSRLVTSAPGQPSAIISAARFRPVCDFHLSLQLITADHFMTLCLGNLDLHWSRSSHAGSPFDRLSSDRSDDTGAVESCPTPGDFKLTCDSATVHCDNQPESILVVRQVTLAKFSMAFKQRADHAKFDLSAKCNDAWMFAANTFTIHFPYRYRFVQFYLEASSMVRYLRRNFWPRKRGSTRTVTTSDLNYDPFTSDGFTRLCPSSTDSCEGDWPQHGTTVSRLRPDYIVRVKYFKLEFMDDPFECRLNQNYRVLLEEEMKYEQRLSAMQDRVKLLSESGIRLSDVDFKACLGRINRQRSVDHQAHIKERANCVSPPLFTWTLEGLNLKSLADSTIATPEQVLDQLKRMDDASPSPNLSAGDFSTLWCRVISLNVDTWKYHLRDFKKSWLAMSDLFVWGRFVGAERTADGCGHRDVIIVPGRPWPKIKMKRSCWPLKFYYDLNADVRHLQFFHGANMQPTLAWLKQRMQDVLPQSWDLSKPQLNWWDRVRHLLHGRVYLASDTMLWSYPTSLDPYNDSEVFTWQWRSSTICWTTGHIHVDGDLVILYNTASKYDGVCRLLNFPGIAIAINLTWLCQGNPHDHHSVRPCNFERLRLLGIMEHDSYANFRSKQLALQLSCTIRPSSLANRKATGLFYTSIMKFVDKLRTSLRRIPQPIRSGPVFRYTASSSSLFRHLLQCLDFSFTLPCFGLTYWVSYANRTGVQVSTGALLVTAQLRREAAPATTSSAQTSRPGRTGTFVWAVHHLSASLHDSSIRLQHQANLPGQVVQMLTKFSRSLQPSGSHTDQEQTGDDDPAPTTRLADDFIAVPLLRYEQTVPASVSPTSAVRVHIPGRRGAAAAGDVDPAAAGGDSAGFHRSKRSHEPSTSAPTVGAPEAADEPPPVTHESLTPRHRLEVHDLKLRWTEHNRNLVYTLMDTYQHAQSLKRNLSARVIHTSPLLSTGPIFRTSGGSSLGLVRSYRNRYPPTVGSCASAVDLASNPGACQMGAGGSDHVDNKDNGEDDPTPNATVAGAAGNLQSSNRDSSLGMSGGGVQPGGGGGGMSMLSQLIDELDTAKFYAYCEEEPKQTDVVGQLQGLAICEASHVIARNWHVELINSQLLLKTDQLDGYVLVTAARAKLDALSHPPIWRDSQLLTKSSLVGHLECMQYFSTVGRVPPGTVDQWLFTNDVRDWVDGTAQADEDTLSGRPEVVGCGRSVGGVVSACPPTPTVSPNLNPSSASLLLLSSGCGQQQGIQLQRMISRCFCQVFFVHYEPVESPEDLPPREFIPPLPLDENVEVVHNQEGGDTVTLLHHTLNICTNSLQYHMIFDIVNDLLLHVEPQRKAQSERNRVEFGLMPESQVPGAILRDQETLRGLVAEQRSLERHLWSFARQIMHLLSSSPKESNPRPGSSSSTSTGQTMEAVLKVSYSLQYASRLESMINALKSRIVDHNAMLSQRLTYYQQLLVRAQRRHIRRGGSPDATEQGVPVSVSFLGARQARVVTLVPEQAMMSWSTSTPSHPPAASRMSDVVASPLEAGGGGPGGGGVDPSGESVSVVNQLGSQLAVGSLAASSCQPLTTAHPCSSAVTFYSVPGPGTNDNQLADSGSAGAGDTGNCLPEEASEEPPQLHNNNKKNKQKKEDESMASHPNVYQPGAVVRRSEVCFEHAHWRMTENDGQIGLADVELRGFLYAKTHRQDDSGSHWLELGWIRVSSLAPNSFYKEVLTPDVASDQYVGGPILRIACSEQAPVGGLSVKGSMEISVAPMVLQVSKLFYHVMMPFFFPVAAEAVALPQAGQSAKASTTYQDFIDSSTQVDVMAGLLDPPSDGTAAATATTDDKASSIDVPMEASATSSSTLSPLPRNRRHVLRDKLSRLFRHSVKSPTTGKDQLGGGGGPETSSLTEEEAPQPRKDKTKRMPRLVPRRLRHSRKSRKGQWDCGSKPVASTGDKEKSPCLSANIFRNGSSMSSISVAAPGRDCNLTVEAAMGLKTTSGVLDSDRLSVGQRTQLIDQLMMQLDPAVANSAAGGATLASLASLSPSTPMVVSPTTTVTMATDETTTSLECAGTSPGLDDGAETARQLCSRCDALLLGRETAALAESLLMPGAAAHKWFADLLDSPNCEACRSGGQSVDVTLNPVDVMRERARQNNVFLYIKIPGLPIRLSYKGGKQKNLMDVTDFKLTIPTLEYHNCVWTWLDFAMEVKTRIRRQLVVEVIKKKFTPRRRLHLTRKRQKAHDGQRENVQGTVSASDGLDNRGNLPNPPSIMVDASISTTTTAANSISGDSLSFLDTQDEGERTQLAQEMILGRQALTAVLSGRSASEDIIQNLK